MSELTLNPGYVGRGSIKESDRHWYYFGCRNSLGHHLYNRRGGNVHLDALHDLDGELCPKDRTPYRALLSRIPHLEYSALAWWDHTVDTRPGSNVIIFAPSLSCSLQSIQAGIDKWFPWVLSRLPQPLTFLEEESVFLLEPKR